MNEPVYQLLEEVGRGKMSSLAYDTAWVARLRDIDSDLSNNALNWLCENQLSDGSWGSERPYYYHDRVISTLAAMIALTQSGRNGQNRGRIEKGLLALEKITEGADTGLLSDPNGATVGFEMIVPTLVAEAEKLGMIKQQGDRILGKMAKFRSIKMSKLNGHKISRNITPAFSLEMAGQDGQNMLDIENLLEPNGSVANSPSATAYFSSYIKPGDQRCISYLKEWVSEDGGAPTFAPIDVFEIGWTLWNLKLTSLLDERILKLCAPHLEFLLQSWNEDFGIGTTTNGTIKDSDDSSLVFEVLSWFGYNVDINAILSYEEDDHFRCFSLEANPSISANIHVLGALKQAGYNKKDASVQKVIGFLNKTRRSENYWLDKWHASPYYATSHAIICAAGIDDELCSGSVKWLLDTQRTNGSWGFYEFPTAEETAYALQALCVWQERNGNIPKKFTESGMHWLNQHSEPPYEPLWIGKGLYSPEKVVRSLILSALDMCTDL